MAVGILMRFLCVLSYCSLFLPTVCLRKTFCDKAFLIQNTKLDLALFKKANLSPTSAVEFQKPSLVISSEALKSMATPTNFTVVVQNQ